MRPNPQYGNPAGDATIALGKFARQTCGDVQELMTPYALDGSLARIAVSEYRDDFVLKGGVLLAAVAAGRPTKDVNLQTTRLTDDPDEVAERVRAIAGLELTDGLEFDPASVTATKIRNEDEYAGVRVKLIATLGTAQLTVKIYVNFGDPIWPAHELIELPRVMDRGLRPVMLLAYPLTMLLVEKIVTAIGRCAANTRWRHFAYVYPLIRLHSIDVGKLRTSVETVAEYRKVTLAPLLPTPAPMNECAQQKYYAWRTRSHREAELPAIFTDVLSAIADFADPVMSAATTEQGV